MPQAHYHGSQAYTMGYIDSGLEYISTEALKVQGHSECFSG